MLLYLQIAFTILSALCIAAVIPLGVWLGWTWAIAFGLAAFLFFGLMLLCKQTLSFRNSEKQNPPTDDDKTQNS
ncbi:MAG: hypothetical protein IJX96_03500 [Clostridia bacterium]|nr:hypothetical protein [Clostridia bacterium]